MTVELKVPAVGESITEVQIGDWLVGVDDRVERDEIVVVIDTDKATVEVPAPVSGRLVKVLKQKGEPAVVGEVIAQIEEGTGAGAAKSARKPRAEPAARRAKEEEQEDEEKPAKDEERAAKAEEPRKRPPGEAAPRVMPAAARLLAEKGLDPGDVQATGPGGRLLKEDVLRHEEGPKEAPAEREEVVPMSTLRLRIAERLVQAQQTAALLTTFNEIDMARVLALRKEHQEAFQERHGVKLGLMSFFVKAAVDALKLVPALNAEIRERAIVYRNHYDIGVAVGGGKGLVVPVLKDADRLSFAAIETAIADFARRARDSKLTVEELTGGTFTISNGGIYGSLLSTPIVNPPQSGILGLHAIQERAVVVAGAIVARPMMYVALTYDHRIVDGREAVEFLKRIKHAVEEPARMLLEV